MVRRLIQREIEKDIFEVALGPIKMRVKRDECSAPSPSGQDLGRDKHDPLAEARRQKGIAPGSVPPLCVLDPDGDIVAHVRRHGAEPCPQWACYHSTMWRWRAGDIHRRHFCCAPLFKPSPDSFLLAMT